jgi:AcrR family transcriptional regulator
MLARILDAATMTFIKGGYRNARIEVVAERADVSVGTIYRYAENKDALFELVLRYAFGEPTALDVELPYRAQSASTAVEKILDRLDAATDFPRLFAAIEVESPPDVGAELEGLIRELYGWQFRYWKALKLIERCAREWPELSMMFYDGYRKALFAAGERYMAMRMRAGLLTTMPDPGVAARLVSETCAFFAMHRHTAPRSEMDDDVAEETVVRAMCNALLPGGVREATRVTGNGGERP